VSPVRVTAPRLMLQGNVAVEAYERGDGEVQVVVLHQEAGANVLVIEGTVPEVRALARALEGALHLLSISDSGEPVHYIGWPTGAPVPGRD